VSKETRTISELVNAISEEMTRLDYKTTVLKQYHIVWNKLCKCAGVRAVNDFDIST
jgi:integrase/recombinase XerD